MSSKQAAMIKENIKRPENIAILDKVAVHERIDFLKSVPIFSGLSEKQIASIAEAATDQWVSNGSYIFHEGEIGKDMYIVRSGDVEVVKESAGGKVINIVKKGEILGEIAVLAEIRRTASLRVRGDVRLIKLEGRRFIDLLRKTPDLCIDVVKILARRLASTHA